MVTQRFHCKAILLLFYNILLASPTTQQNDSYHHIEWPPYDGWYNNLANPNWGGAETQLFRRVPPAYSDGVYEPSGTERPNPMEISLNVFNGSTGLPSLKNRTAFLVFFGQQVVEEILDAQRPGCPPEYFNLPIPKGHPQYDEEGRGEKEQPLLRSRYDMNTGYSPNVPRMQLNEISAWIDGSLTYGPNKAWTDALRSFKDGLLLALNDSDSSLQYFPAENDIRLPMANPPPPRDHELKPIRRFYRLGNPRGNENPFLLTFGILWFRYHNFIARQVKAKHPNWNDERIFNEARKKVIAVHQKIVMYDWLPSWVQEESLPEYSGYDPTINPGIAHVFQSAAMRFGHTLVPPGVFRRNADCKFYSTTAQTGGTGKYKVPTGKAALRTCNTYWNPQEGVNEHDIDALLLGMASQITEREDMIITPDLRGNVFGPLEFSRRDLMAINIQRGRDHGLPDYNTVREYYNLSRITKWEDINPALYQSDPGIFERLKNIYNDNLNNLDLWPAGMLETGANGPGKLFSAIIVDQFRRIRDGDRFWFENYKLNKLFTKAEVDEIKMITIRDIVIATTNIPDNATLQQDPFFVDANTSCVQPFQLTADNATHLAECTRIRYFDYFTGSEWSYALSFTLLFATFFVFLAMLFCIAKIHEKRVRKEMAQQREVAKRKSDEGFMTAVEWVSRKKGEREVRILLSEKKKQILIQSTRGKLLRTIDLKLLKAKESTDNVDIFMSADKNQRMIVLRIPREYDLLLRFNDSGERDVFYKTFLQKFLSNCGLSLKETYSPEDIILNTSYTVDMRSKEIEAFFAAIFHNLSQMVRKRSSSISSDIQFGKVLRFDNSKEKNNFYEKLKDFTNKHGMKVNSPRAMTEKGIKNDSFTQDKRQEILNTFFRAVFAHAFKYDTAAGEAPDHDIAQNVITCELTKYEFAEALALKPESLFVENMFQMVDKDNNGYISFREFLDVIVVFSKGSAEDKAKLMFDMYDLDGTGTLSKEELKTMLRSMMELANDKLEENKMDELISTMFHDIGLESKSEVTFTDFNKLLKDYKEELSYASLNIHVDGKQQHQPKPAARENGISRARRTIIAAYKNEHDENATSKLRRLSSINEVKTLDKKLPQTPLEQKMVEVRRFFETYRLHIFWCTLYTLVVGGIFAERAYYYSVEREHGGLRRIAGYGVTVTRGAASAMMFTYSCLLVTMCRNTITKLRETFLHRYIPFDAAISFHKYIAYVALFFTIMHCIGHAINFYHVATQTADDLTCLFRNFFHATDELPKFHYWLYNTITGFTGVLLTLLVFIMYIFATQYARRNSFRAFWYTHHLYVALFILMILHGAGRLVQPPFFHYFFLGPAILFTLDKLVSISRRKVEIQVLQADILPSDVTHLRFTKPPNFQYQSGQWVRIASLVQGSDEYHPFTLTSAPHEEWLSLHIRAVGPWTMGLRKLYDPNNLKEHALPKIYLDGPYGEGHQDWYRYDVAVLVGGGIGVTPFASILKDLAHRSRSKERIRCKKVYFLWVTRTQKQFEWLTDIIREVEEKDVRNLVSVHIFITQYKEKFDVRTTMLYICERYFQKISSRSLFTGLRSVTHFGRPDFSHLFQSLLHEHNDTNVFGVFSCGPPPMTANVDKACSDVNKYTQNALFVHHYENF